MTTTSQTVLNDITNLNNSIDEYEAAYQKLVEIIEYSKKLSIPSEKREEMSSNLSSADLSKVNIIFEQWENVNNKADKLLEEQKLFRTVFVLRQEEWTAVIWGNTGYEEYFDENPGLLKNIAKLTGIIQKITQDEILSFIQKYNQELIDGFFNYLKNIINSEEKPEQ